MSKEKMITEIRKLLPKHMLPAFNSITGKHYDDENIEIFLQAYMETIKQTTLAPIQAWDAFEEKNKADKENDIKPEPEEELPEVEVVIEDSEDFAAEEAAEILEKVDIPEEDIPQTPLGPEGEEEAK